VDPPFNQPPDLHSVSGDRHCQNGLCRDIGNALRDIGNACRDIGNKATGLREQVFGTSRTLCRDFGNADKFHAFE
jgi:hypothetical protein